MRKVLILLCILFLCSCSRDNRIPVKRIEDGYTLEKIAEGLKPLYGGGYRYVETEDGYKIETFDECYSNELFKNDTVEICREEIYDDETGKYLNKYTYISGDLTSVLFIGDGKYHWENEVYPSYPTAFEIDNTLYFSYYIDEELIINEIIKGRLVETKRYPVIDGDYTLLGFDYDEDEVYFIYESNDSMKYVFEEDTYEFKKTDRTIILNDYIIYSSFETGKATASYVIDRKTNEMYQFKENVEFLLDSLYYEMPTVFDYDTDDNGFIFVESIDGTKQYVYGKWIGDSLKVYQLPFEKHENDSCRIYKDNVIFYTDEVDGLLDFYVVYIDKGK